MHVPVSIFSRSTSTVWFGPHIVFRVRLGFSTNEVIYIWNFFKHNWMKTKARFWYLSCDFIIDSYALWSVSHRSIFQANHHQYRSFPISLSESHRRCWQCTGSLNTFSTFKKKEKHKKNFNLGRLVHQIQKCTLICWDNKHQKQLGWATINAALWNESESTRWDDSHSKS